MKQAAAVLDGDWARQPFVVRGCGVLQETARLWLSSDSLNSLNGEIDVRSVREPPAERR